MPGRPFPAVPNNFAAEGTGTLNNIPLLDANFTDVKADINDSAIGYVNYAADTGAANAYVVTLASAPSAYVAGMAIMMKPANSNAAGGSTINVSSLGTQSILNAFGNNPVANDIVGSSSQSGTLTSGSLVVTALTSTAGLAIGQGVSGTGIPAGATIADILTSTSLNMSIAATATGAQTLAFAAVDILLVHDGTAFRIMSPCPSNNPPTFVSQALVAVTTAQTVNCLGAQNVHIFISLGQNVLLTLTNVRPGSYIGISSVGTGPTVALTLAATDLNGVSYTTINAVGSGNAYINMLTTGFNVSSAIAGLFATVYNFAGVAYMALN